MNFTLNDDSNQHSHEKSEIKNLQDMGKAEMEQLTQQLTENHLNPMNSHSTEKIMMKNEIFIKQKKYDIILNGITTEIISSSKFLTIMVTIH